MATVARTYTAYLKYDSLATQPRKNGRCLQHSSKLTPHRQSAGWPLNSLNPAAPPRRGARVQHVVGAPQHQSREAIGCTRRKHAHPAFSTMAGNPHRRWHKLLGFGSCFGVHAPNVMTHNNKNNMVPRGTTDTLTLRARKKN